MPAGWPGGVVRLLLSVAVSYLTLLLSSSQIWLIGFRSRLGNHRGVVLLEDMCCKPCVSLL